MRLGVALRNKAVCKDCSFVYRRPRSQHLATAYTAFNLSAQPMQLDSLGKSLQIGIDHPIRGAPGMIEPTTLVS